MPVDSKCPGDNFAAMNVTLPPPLEEFVRNKVESGDFPSVDAVVRGGLRLLQRQDEWKADVRMRVEVGWAQAKAGQLLSPELVQENLAERKAHWSLPKP